MDGLGSLLAAAMVMLLVMAGVFGLLYMLGAPGRTFNRRLRLVLGAPAAAPGAPELHLERRVQDSAIPSFDRLIKTLLPNVEKFRNWLARTGLSLTVGEFLLVSALAGVGGFALFHLVFEVKIAGALLGAGAAGWLLPRAWVNGLARKRAKNFIRFFPESIDAMVRSIRSGLPVAEAVNVVAEEMPDPVGAEFRAIRDGVRMGRSLEEAMWDVARHVDVPEYRYLIIALSIQRETGGNLGETLANVAEVLRKRRQIKLKIKAMSSEARASAMILGALPFVVVGILALVSSGYVAILFSDPRGHVLLGIALGMMGTGMWLMAQMISFEI